MRLSGNINRPSVILVLRVGTPDFEIMSSTFEADVVAPCSVINGCTEARSIADRWQDIVRGIRAEYLDHTHRFPWVIGFSGGKD
jgi:hypothetical protein